MTMVKQRRSFFVDDILHMVMPMTKNADCSNETNDRKRKRSILTDDEHHDEVRHHEDEDESTKKFRTFTHEDDDDDDDDDLDEESKHSHIVDGATGDESLNSDNSNSVDDNSGTFPVLSFCCYN